MIEGSKHSEMPGIVSPIHHAPAAPLWFHVEHVFRDGTEDP